MWHGNAQGKLESPATDWKTYSLRNMFVTYSSSWHPVTGFEFWIYMTVCQNVVIFSHCKTVCIASVGCLLWSTNPQVVGSNAAGIFVYILNIYSDIAIDLYSWFPLPNLTFLLSFSSQTHISKDSIDKFRHVCKTFPSGVEYLDFWSFRCIELCNWRILY